MKGGGKGVPDILSIVLVITGAVLGNRAELTISCIIGRISLANPSSTVSKTEAGLLYVQLHPRRGQVSPGWFSKCRHICKSMAES